MASVGTPERSKAGLTPGRDGSQPTCRGEAGIEKSSTSTLYSHAGQEEELAGGQKGPFSAYLGSGGKFQHRVSESGV